MSLGILRRLRAWRERRRDQRRARQLWSQEMVIDAEFRRTLAELEEAGSGLVTADRCYRLARALGFRMEDLLGLLPLVEQRPLRYLLFAGDTHYPAGGANDYREAYDTREAAIDAYERRSERWWDWGHVAELTDDGLVIVWRSDEQAYQS